MGDPTLTGLISVPEKESEEAPDPLTSDRPEPNKPTATVEIDLTKPLTGTICFQGKKQQVIYEGLPTLCYSCGKVDHTMAACPLLNLVNNSSPTDRSNAGDSEADLLSKGKEKESTSNPSQPCPSPGVGAWMNAPVRSRIPQQRRYTTSQTPSAKVHVPIDGSRFAILAQDLDKNGGIEGSSSDGQGPWITVATTKNPKPRKYSKKANNGNPRELQPTNPAKQTINPRTPLSDVSNTVAPSVTSAHRVSKSPTPGKSTSTPISKHPASIAPISQPSATPSVHTRLTTGPHPSPHTTASSNQHSVVPADSTSLTMILTPQEVESVAESSRQAAARNTQNHSPLQRTNPKQKPPDINSIDCEPLSPPAANKTRSWGIAIKKAKLPPFKKHGKRGNLGPISEEIEDGSSDDEMILDIVENADAKCKGAAKPQFPRSLKLFTQRYNPLVVVIVEPRISGSSASRVVRKLGFRSSHRVEARGFSRGIWALWREELVSVHFLISHAQFIHMKITGDTGSFLFTAVYGSPSNSPRRALWRNIELLASSISEPWLLAGDFNTILDTSESSKPRRTPSSSSRDFHDCLLNSGLLDLGFSGPTFTWKRGNLKKRLDRALGNSAWTASFPQAEIYHLSFLNSDHRPLLIIPAEGANASTRPRRLLFQAAWTRHKDFERFVAQNWDKSASWSTALTKFTDSLQHWQKSIYGNTASRKRKLLARIQGIQDYLDKKPSQFLSTLELDLRYKWTPSGPLHLHLNTPIPATMLDEKVALYANSGKHWLWSRFDALIPDQIQQEIRAICCPSRNRGPDRVCWEASAKGDFTTRSAYESLEAASRSNTAKNWKLLWKWRGAQMRRRHYSTSCEIAPLQETCGTFYMVTAG
ncbi:hypothetical protein Tsubulata_026333 [Turnera subulata]|uniref:Endonuclease/exonuclease/phosphatase domain-containing protein n=1 Tax=Turnera subulata TaxID=218843 RepID=A0A9Q0F3R5_9ROSI|nr:hypothetical protein Tsubulata_026333 [Turnera subulata]